jgi:hypothetical protein
LVTPGVSLGVTATDISLIVHAGMAASES